MSAKNNVNLFHPKNKHNMQKFGHMTELFIHDLTFTPREGDSITMLIRLVTPILEATATLVSQT